MRIYFLVIIIGFLFASCSKKITEAETGEIFYLKYHKAAEVEEIATGNKLTVKYDELEEDSRCPEGAVCVWSGQVIVRLLVNGTEVKAGLLGNTGDGMYGDYIITLISAEPYPEINKNFEKKESVIGLEITKQ